MFKWCEEAFRYHFFRQAGTNQRILNLLLIVMMFLVFLSLILMLRILHSFGLCLLISVRRIRALRAGVGDR